MSTVTFYTIIHRRGGLIGHKDLAFVLAVVLLAKNNVL